MNIVELEPGERFHALSLQIVEYNPIERDLAQLKHELAGRVYDLTTPEGEKEARTDVRLCTKMRTTLESAREGLKRPVLARGRLIDAEAKRIRLLIEAVEDPIAEQLKVIDDAREAEKQRRLAEIEERRTALRKKVFDTFTIPAGIAVGGGKASVLRELMEKIHLTAVDAESFGDLSGEAQQAKTEALEALAPALREATERESRDREAAEQRQIADEKRRAEEAEAKRLQAEKDAELERLRAQVATQQATDPPAQAAVTSKAPDADEVIAIAVARVVRAATDGDFDLSKREALAIYYGCLDIAECQALDAMSGI